MRVMNTFLENTRLTSSLTLKTGWTIPTTLAHFVTLKQRKLDIKDSVKDWND